MAHGPPTCGRLKEHVYTFLVKKRELERLTPLHTKSNVRDMSGAHDFVCSNKLQKENIEIEQCTIPYHVLHCLCSIFRHFSMSQRNRFSISPLYFSLKVTPWFSLPQMSAIDAGQCCCCVYGGATATLSTSEEGGGHATCYIVILLCFRGCPLNGVVFSLHT